jgi:3-oxoacyl-[acyl-carrier protein] reductase
MRLKRTGGGKRPLADRVALITGGSRGIGLASAEALLGAGARVAICARDSERLDEAERRLASQGEVLCAPVDVRDPQRVEAFVASVTEHYGAVDVLVNNAGVVWVGDYAEQAQAGIDEVIDVNLKGTMHMARAVLPGMLQRGDGAIVNIASGAGLHGFPKVVAYCASKFGVVGFTESLAQEVENRGVRVYGICPGRVATDMQVEYSGARVGIPPEQVAERVLELANPKTRTRTGSCITVG